MPAFMDLFRNLFVKRYYGVYPARVVDIEDPHQLGRVQISLPDLLGNGEPYNGWARMSAFMAGTHRGAWFLPEVDDEVLVAFEHGDPRGPYILGALWNEVAPPPEQMDGSGQNRVKSLHSHNGILISLFDGTGEEVLLMQTPGGQSVMLQDGKGGSVEIKDVNGNVIRLSPEGVQVSASAKVSVQASVVEISAGSVKVDAGLSTFSGTIKADTVITNSVISSSYTPGAGNVM